MGCQSNGIVPVCLSVHVQSHSGTIRHADTKIGMGIDLNEILEKFDRS